MKRPLRLPLILVMVVLLCLAVFSACNFSPVRSVAPTESVAGFVLPTSIPTRTSTPLPTPTALPSEENCTDIMQYVDDINFSDKNGPYEARPGEVIDKQWLVKNAGTCNWGPGYTLRVTENIGDVTLKERYDLYPALSKSEAVIQLVITLPEEEGEYSFTLEAFNKEDKKFPEYISWSFVIQNASE